MNINLVNEIKQICNTDKYEIGFAKLTGLLNPNWNKYSYGISLIRKLDNSIIDKIINGPTIEYYHHYNDINDELNQKTDEILSLLKSNNIDAVAIKATVEDKALDDDYRRTLRYPFSHKLVATQAGLGWIGKTDLLITDRFGPRLRLASILISSSISEIGKPINESFCGKCNLCVINCPAQAATGRLWNSNIDRDEFYSPFKCRQYCRKISEERIEKEISLCGICISVCPKGEKSKNNKSRCKNEKILY